MYFGYFTLVVAFFLSIVAAYYSVLGLVAIFSAAVIPVMIMGGALETGKIVAAMWLHRNWDRAPWTYKAYLLPSLLALMLLTSMGTFGYLSKAHSDQSLVSGDVTSKIALYDEKIRISKENIDANRAALKQLDASVDQTLSRSTTEQGAERSVQIRRQQGPERTRLLRDIETEQKKIAQLNEERAPIAAEVRKVEAEVGPIKYIAALIYGDNPEANLLESAVRWVIILIVVVFDPLAIVLILAGTRHLDWEREMAKNKKIVEVDSTPSVEPDVKIEIEQQVESVVHEPVAVKRTRRKKNDQDKPPAQVESNVPDTNQQDKSWRDVLLAKEFAAKIKEPAYIEMPKYEFIDEEFIKLNGIPKNFAKLKDEDAMLHNLITQQQEKIHEIQEAIDDEVKLSYKEPSGMQKGDIYVNISTMPPRVYKYTGSDWINLQNFVKSNYLETLVENLEQGILSIEDLNEKEQMLIKEYLLHVENNNTTG